LFGEGLVVVEEVSLLRAFQRREHAIEREALWGTIKSRIDGGHVIDVCQVSVAGAERAGAGS
jgi:hypothetical protein